MSSTECNFNMSDTVRLAVLMVSLVFVLGPPSQVEARNKRGSIEREADCHRDKACIEEYSQKKSAWLACLDSAGLSEKKRHKLSAKVEAMGIHSFKRQEILTFNSKRKDCNKDFMKNLSEMHTKKAIEQDKDKSLTIPPLKEKAIEQDKDKGRATPPLTDPDLAVKEEEF